MEEHTIEMNLIDGSTLKLENKEVQTTCEFGTQYERTRSETEFPNQSIGKTTTSHKWDCSKFEASTKWGHEPIVCTKESKWSQAKR